MYLLKTDMLNRFYLFSVAVLSCLSCQGRVPDSGGDNDILASLPKAESTYIMDSCEDISSYQSNPATNRTSLYMAKGEAEHFQVVIVTSKKGRLAPSFENPVDGLSWDVCEIREFNGKDDVMVSCRDGEIQTSSKVVKLWVSCRTSREIPAGDYQNIISFRGTAGEYRIGVNVRVYDVVMPEVSSLPSLFGINSSMVDDSASGEKLLAKRREMSDMLLERRITPYFCKWWAGTMQTQCSTSPYGWSDPRTPEYLSGAKVSHVLMPNIEMSVEELRESAEIVGKACPGKTRVYYPWDEPADIGSYERIRQLAADIHEADPDGKVITTFYCGPLKDNGNLDDILSVWTSLSEATSYFCTSTWMLGPAPEQRSAAFAEKCSDSEEWWSYVCMAETPGLAYNSTGFQNRAAAWRSYRDGNKGFLYWAVNAFSSLHPLKGRSDLPAGDGILVYPGQPFGKDGFLPSVRLERFSDGLEDYDLLKMVEDRKSRTEALEILSKVYRSPTEVAVKASAVRSFRRELLEALAE